METFWDKHGSLRKKKNKQEKKVYREKRNQ